MPPFFGRSRTCPTYGRFSAPTARRASAGLTSAWPIRKKSTSFPGRVLSSGVRTGAVGASGRTISVILQYRFNRDALLLKRMVDRGLLGEILFANVVNYIHRDGEYFGANGGWRGT